MATGVATRCCGLPVSLSQVRRRARLATSYDTLSDPEKRKQYDAFGTANGRRVPGSDPRDFNFGGGGNFTINDLGDLGDLFGGIFNRGQAGRARRQPERGADIEVPVSLSFEDSLRGLETKIPVEVTTACRECG